MEGKTYQKEMQVIVTLFGLLLITGIYSLYVYNKYITKNPEIINDFQFWGKAFLVLILVMIVSMIILMIVFAIVNKIVTNEDIPSLSDEMDKLIDLKAIRISRWVYSLCFILAMASQAIGMQPWVMFVILISSCFAGGIAEGIAKIYYYRKGV